MLVDKIYSLCLSLLDKENRGTISPEQFNLSATKNQNRIFSEYFGEYNLNNLRTNSDMSTKGLSNMAFLVREKLSGFVTSGILSKNSQGSYTKPSDLFVIEQDSVYSIPFQSMAEGLDASGAIRAQSVSGIVTKDFPIYTDSDEVLKVYPDDSVAEGAPGVTLTYVRKPKDINWTYVVLNGEVVFNPSDSFLQDVELHPSELNSMVVGILADFGLFVSSEKVAVFAENKAIREEKQGN